MNWRLEAMDISATASVCPLIHFTTITLLLGIWLAPVSSQNESKLLPIAELISGESLPSAAANFNLKEVPPLDGNERWILVLSPDQRRQFPRIVQIREWSLFEIANCSSLRVLGNGKKMANSVGREIKTPLCAPCVTDPVPAFTLRNAIPRFGENITHGIVIGCKKGKYTLGIQLNQVGMWEAHASFGDLKLGPMFIEARNELRPGSASDPTRTAGGGRGTDDDPQQQPDANLAGVPRRNTELSSSRRSRPTRVRAKQVSSLSPPGETPVEFDSIIVRRKQISGQVLGVAGSKIFLLVESRGWGENECGNEINARATNGEGFGSSAEAVVTGTVASCARISRDSQGNASLPYECWLSSRCERD